LLDQIFFELNIYYVLHSEILSFVKAARREGVDNFQNGIKTSKPKFIIANLKVKKIHIRVQLVAKETGNENFFNVNLILSICQLIVYLTIPIT
jgi:hypothetical protein